MTENPFTGHGSLSEEAMKLAETLQAWLSTGSAMTGAGNASECKVCPVCQLIGVVNGLKPEVLGHLTEAGFALAAAFKAATDKAATDRDATGRDATGRAGTDGVATDSAAHAWASSDRPPVQHIDVI